MMRPALPATSEQAPSRTMGDAHRALWDSIMNKATRGVMPELRGLAKATAMLCACGSASIALPALASTTVTTITYDAGNHVTSVTDPRGLVTTYTYDGLSQLWEQASPDTGTTTYVYDSAGRRTSMIRADGTATTYGYDSLSRVTSVSAGGQVQHFAYDSCPNGLGRLCTVSDGTGTTAYSYTPEGWLSGRGFTIGSTSYTLNYSHNAEGQVTAVLYPDNNEAAYSYTDGVVSGVTLTVAGTPVTGASAITYQPGDKVMAGWTSSNGLTNTLTYDSDGRLTGIAVPGVESLDFGYDKANRITEISNGIDTSQSEAFDYDDQSRLTGVYGGSDMESYSYDADGNRLSQAVNGASATFSYSATSNRLLSLSGVLSATYGYDAQGNTTVVNGTTTYQYDPFNRLSNGGATDYVNPEGQRLRKSGESTGTTYFAPDAGNHLLAENDNSTWVDYVWLNGRLIGRIAGGAVDAIHDDQTGRPQVVTDAGKAVVWKADNYPFERTVVQDDIGGLNLGFPGQYYDAERWMWNNGYRDYNAGFGRYNESDPMGLYGGINTYAYVGNDPLSNVDPLGLCPTCTQLKQTAANLADALDAEAKTSGALAFGSAFGTGLAGFFEPETAGFDTPATVALGEAASYFGAVTLGSHAAASALNSFASGNTLALQSFAVNEIMGKAVGSVADRIPGVSKFTKNFEQLATQVTGIATEAPEACPQQ